MTHAPWQASPSAQPPTASTVLHFPLCPQTLPLLRGSRVTAFSPITPAAGQEVLTKAELMASTNSSSSMLTSSAACSWDVDQTKELKVSESCVKRRASAWCGGTCLPVITVGSGRECQASLGTVLNDKGKQGKPAL